MDGRVGQSQRLWCFYVGSTDLIGKSGLTVTLDFQTSTGTATGLSASAGGIDGFYYYDWTPTASGWLVYAFQTATTTVKQMHLPGLISIDSSDFTAAGIADAAWDEPTADHTTVGTAGAALGRIGTNQTTIVSPVSSASTSIELVRGDDYCSLDSRELSFSNDDWPNLTGSTEITLTLRRNPGSGSDTVVFSITDTTSSRVTSSTGGTQTVIFEPRSSQTTDIETGENSFKWDVAAVLPATTGVTARHVTLLTGLGTGVEDQTRST